MQTLERWLVILAATGAILFAFMWQPIRAYDDPHGLYHEEFYRKWLTKDGYSCCNSRAHTVNGDCSPIADNRVRSTADGVAVFLEGEWITVAPEKVRPYMPPDMSNHVCHRGKTVLCFVHGGGT